MIVIVKVVVNVLRWHNVQGASECGFHLKKRTPQELVVFIEVTMEASNYHLHSFI